MRGSSESMTHTAPMSRRWVYAQELVQQKGIKNVTVLVDGMEQKTHETFGWLPNMVYVADREGTIVYKASWTKPEILEGVIQEVLAEEKEEDKEAVPA